MNRITGFAVIAILFSGHSNAQSTCAEAITYPVSMLDVPVRVAGVLNTCYESAGAAPAFIVRQVLDSVVSVTIFFHHEADIRQTCISRPEVFWEARSGIQLPVLEARSVLGKALGAIKREKICAVSWNL